MASKILPKGKQNLARVLMICVDVLKLPLKDILASEIQPADLYNKIQRCRSLMNGKHKLLAHQHSSLLSSPLIPNYEKFDVSLLYKLIRNLCPNLKPTKEWGNHPEDTDTRIGDDIERIRFFRNTYAHSDLSEISDNDFEVYLKKLTSVFKRFQIYMTSKGYNQNYEEKLTYIKQMEVVVDALDLYMVKYLLESKCNSDVTEEPRISVEDPEDVLCGCTAELNAVIYPGNLEGWSVSWQKRVECADIRIDSRAEKYTGSTDKTLVIRSVCKADEGKYQAILSRDSSSNKMIVLSNVVFLKAIEVPPIFDVWNVSTADERIKIHYGLPNAEISTEQQIYFGSKTILKAKISSNPSPHRVEWQKSNDGKTFESVHIDRPEFYGSSCIPESPLLVIPKVTFEDKLHYRLLAVNKIGKQYSNTVFLNVKGSPPNITVNHWTSLSTKSIKLKGNVFVYESLPAVQNVFWTKDEERIDTRGSGGRYTDVSVKNPSLTIFEVNEYDAGSYQLTAINDVGSTTSDSIILAIPDVSFAKPEKTNDGSFRFKVTITSIPAPYFAQWSMKEKSCDNFEPIDACCEKFKGTLSTLPHPVLVVNPETDLENYSFQIEVYNFIGCCKKIVPAIQVEDSKAVYGNNTTSLMTEEVIYNRRKPRGVQATANADQLLIPHQVHSKKPTLLAGNNSYPDSIKEIHNGLIRTLIIGHVGNDKASYAYVNWKTHFNNYCQDRVHKEKDVLQNFLYLEDKNIISPGKYDAFLRIFSEDADAIKTIKEATSKIATFMFPQNPRKQTQTPIQVEESSAVYATNETPVIHAGEADMSNRRQRRVARAMTNADQLLIPHQVHSKKPTLMAGNKCRGLIDGPNLN